MLVIGVHTIQGMHLNKIYVNHMFEQILENKCSPSRHAVDLLCDFPRQLKDFGTFSFAKEVKHYLLSERRSK